MDLLGDSDAEEEEKGPVEINRTVPDLIELESKFPRLLPGGSYRPACNTTNKVAIVIPYRFV